MCIRDRNTTRRAMPGILVDVAAVNKVCVLYRTIPGTRNNCLAVVLRACAKQWVSTSHHAQDAFYDSIKGAPVIFLRLVN